VDSEKSADGPVTGQGAGGNYSAPALILESQSDMQKLLAAVLVAVPAKIDVKAALGACRSHWNHGIRCIRKP
jgi:hypothetical protein